MKYTKDQKKEYFQGLRDRWAENKKLADNDQQAQALYNEVGGDVSYYSFFFVLQDLRRLGLSGTPYIDTKTFRGWQSAGFVVKKGERSNIHGITWLAPKDKDGNEDGSFRFPKRYNLFHRSQVQEI